MNLDEAPILVFWETTLACQLACRHCRAQAQLEPAPGELSTDEGRRLISQLAGFGPRPPVLVMTGGDVMSRPDLFELVEAAQRTGLRVALAPSVTPRLVSGALERLRGLGVISLSLSLDGSSPATHEGIRGVPGHFAATLDALRLTVSLGFKVQVNTTVMKGNIHELAATAQVVRDVGATSWEVFFLVKVGRGRDEQELTADENEDVAHVLFEASQYGFAVRTVEGPWCRRVASWRQKGQSNGQGGPAAAGAGDAAAVLGLGPLYHQQSSLLRHLLGPPTSPPQMATAGTRDGKGILFIAHNGSVYPAGFLPLALGNVRYEDPVAIYRQHPLLQAIRAADFGGKCGRCDYRGTCGGSRARAFATFGDPLAEDPACAYLPA